MTSPSPEHAHSYRPDIDGLRAIAVSAVVLHHAFPNAFPGGYVGVDIFFVISGYLISSIILGQLQRGTFSFREFYARRVKRIFPALLLVLCSTLTAGWYLLTAEELRQLGKHALAGTAFLSNFAFWREAGYFDASAASKPLLHLWSLAIEEQFYIFWPLLLFFAFRIKQYLWAVVLGLLLASFAWNIWLVNTDITAAFYNPAARFWEMLIGAMLALLHQSQYGTSRRRFRPEQQMRLAQLASGAGLIVIALLAWQLSPTSRFPGWWAMAATCSTALIIAAGPSAWINKHILSSRPFVWIGLISYPLYLWHWPIFSLAYVDNGGHPPFLAQLQWTVLAIVLATATYWLLERPIRFGRVRAWAYLTPALVCGIAALGATGLLLFKRELPTDHLPALLANLHTKRGEPAVTEGWRHKDCMLDYNVPPSEFKPFCTESKRPLLFIWGDSHAASLYPGFKSLQDSGRYQFGIAERTGAICPPVLGIEPRPGCQALNDHTIEAIRDTKPDIVLLYAWWHEDKTYGRYNLTKLEDTVKEIRAAGVPRIVLLGAVPYWRGDLPRILLRLHQGLPEGENLPLRLGDAYIDPHVRAATEEMRRRSEAMGIEFISGMEYFCNSEGCLTRLDPSSTEPLSYDYGHLSIPAVNYYVQQIAPLIFNNR